MNCQATNNLLQDFIDGSLTGSVTKLVSAHLEECSACRESYQNTLSVIELLKNTHLPSASADFTTRVLANAEASREKHQGDTHFITL